MGNNKCRICGNEYNTEEYVLKEMMFGTREKFGYFRCLNCGCLQIKSFPENINNYYPSNYLSFPKIIDTGFKKYLLEKRENYLLSERGLIGKLLTLIFGIPQDYRWRAEIKLKKDDKILEIGCGAGELLIKMKNAGFKNLLGADPFIEKDMFFDDSLKIFRKKISQIDDLQFDFVMFHHSFEHLANPHETFEELNKRVNNGGSVLIRIPVIDSYAWENYKTDWVQLDPPRHFFLYTIKSMKYLANKNGFEINKIVYDSTAFQFIGSEQYKKGIPLMSTESYFINPNNRSFLEEEIIEFQKKAEELNQNEGGDTACFYLTKRY